jgi:methylmalonyl-CoA mutase C-terminal domain/subunit
VAVTAVEQGADVVGVSILSGAHLTLLPRLGELMNEAGGEHITLIAGGVLPREDIPELEAAGVERALLAGTPVSEIVEDLKDMPA